MSNTPNFLKQTAKKIHKSGFFSVKHFSKTAISFGNGSFICSCQKPENARFWLLRIGYVVEGQVFKTVYPDHYQPKWVETAVFRPLLEQSTDNPNYVIREALNYFLPQPI